MAKNNWLNYFIVACFIIGAFFRLYNLGVPALWQDEAESCLHSINVLEKGFPVGFYRVPFYENAYLYPSEDRMYQFKETNYLNTQVVTIKGWLTYYISALFFVFGKTNFIARLPFALFGIASLFVLYFLAKLLFGKKVAAVALFLQAVSPGLIYYERQSRYYSLEIFLILATVFVFAKAFRQRKTWPFILGAILAGLLFHTHILACACLLSALLAYMLFFHKKLLVDRKIIYSAVLFLAFTLPWLFLVKYAFTGQPNVLNFGSGWQQAWYYPINSLASHSSIYILAEVGILFLVLSLLFPEFVKTRKLNFGDRKANTLLLILLLTFTVLSIVFVPYSSFGERLFLPLVPFLLIVAAAFFICLLSLFKGRWAKAALIMVLLLLTFCQANTIFGREGIKHDGLIEIVTGKLDNRANWVLNDIEFLKSHNASKNALVLSTDEHFSFLYYSGFTVQSIWPVRKSFIDAYKGELWVIERQRPDGVCSYLFMYLGKEKYCGKNKSYIDRLNRCDRFTPGSGSTIYRCLP